MALLIQGGGLRPNGFYVDVGAFHPFLFSNTAALHRSGWRGVNVEPNPDMAARLRQARPQDITLEVNQPSAGQGLVSGREEFREYLRLGRYGSEYLRLNLFDSKVTLGDNSTSAEVTATAKADTNLYSAKRAGKNKVVS